MNIINETDQIRISLSKIRLLRENMGDVNVTDDYQTNNQQQDVTTDKSGYKVEFDGINTVGFINNQLGHIDDNVKNTLTTSIGEFIKNSAILTNTVDITIGNNRLVILVNTINNPGVDIIKGITIDTEKEDPEISVISGNLALSNDVIGLLQSIKTAYNDNQSGRASMMAALQGSSNNNNSNPTI